MKKDVLFLTGIENFSTIIEKDAYYVDKTSYLKELFMSSSEVMNALFIRPRRFGKTLNMNMIKSFCELNYQNPGDKSDQKKLFVDNGRNLAVAGDDYKEFREKIENAGATFVSCDGYDFEMEDKDNADRVGKDKVFATELLVSSTLALDDMTSRAIEDIKPDIVVSDSVAFWGKLVAMKHNLPYVSSTTTFAFNRYSAKYMQESIWDIGKMLFAMPRKTITTRIQSFTLLNTSNHALRLSRTGTISLARL